MKTKLTLTFLFALFIGAFANGQENKKFHLKINTIENGKSFNVDTTFATREEMDAYLEKNGLAVPDPPLPPAQPAHPRSPLPPNPPKAPKAPKAPDLPKEREITIDIDAIELSKEQKEEIRIEMEVAQKELEKALEQLNMDQQEMEKARELMNLDQLEMEKAQQEMHRSQQEMEKEMKRMEIEVEKAGEDGERVIIKKIDNDDGNGNYKTFIMNGDETQDATGKICVVRVYNDSQNPEENQVKIVRKIKVEGESKGEMKMRSPMPDAVTVVENPAPQVAKTSVSHELVTSDFKLYPNPTEGKINISFRTEQPGTIHVKLMDSRGRVLVDEDVETADGYFNKEYSIENKSKGTYLLQLKQGDQWRHEKIVVK